MVLYKGYCRPLGKKVDFTVKDVISMNTKRGIKWRVKGTYDNYNISTFCSKLVAEDLLNKLPLTMDAEIAYTPAAPTYESEELLPLFSNATKNADEIEAEEETIEVQEQIQENTNAQELDLHSEKLPAKYYKKNGSLDMRYSICREYAAKRAESQNAVELEAPSDTNPNSSVDVLRATMKKRKQKLAELYQELEQRNMDLKDKHDSDIATYGKALGDKQLRDRIEMTERKILKKIDSIGNLQAKIDAKFNLSYRDNKVLKDIRSNDSRGNTTPDYGSNRFDHRYSGSERQRMLFRKRAEESFDAEDMITVKEIDWETDGEKIDLPTTMEVPSDLEEDEIADYLSDQKGWLVNGFVMGAESFEAEEWWEEYRDELEAVDKSSLDDFELMIWNDDIVKKHGKAKMMQMIINTLEYSTNLSPQLARIAFKQEKDRGGEWEEGMTFEEMYNPNFENYSAESFEAAYTPEQKLDDYTPEQLTTSSAVTGDFFEDSLKYSYGGIQAAEEIPQEETEIVYAEGFPALQNAEAGMVVENIENYYKDKEDKFMTLVVDEATLFRLASDLPIFVESTPSKYAGYTNLKFNYVENPDLEQKILSYAISLPSDMEQQEEPEYLAGDVRNRLFNVEFDDWTEQEMKTHGKDVSFKEWADEESKSHGDEEFMDWAKHEEESHDERYEAEGGRNVSDFEMGNTDRYEIGDEIIALSSALKGAGDWDWKNVKKIGKGIKQGKYERIQKHMADIDYKTRRVLWDKHHNDFYNVFNDEQMRGLAIPWVTDKYKAESFGAERREPVFGDWEDGVVMYADGSLLVKVVGFPTPFSNDPRLIGESMWVVVKKGNEYEGKGYLSNDPIHSSLKFGTLIDYGYGTNIRKPMFKGSDKTDIITLKQMLDPNFTGILRTTPDEYYENEMQLFGDEDEEILKEFNEMGLLYSIDDKLWNKKMKGFDAESFDAEGKGNKQENSNHRELIAFYEDLEHLVYNTQFEGDYEDTLYYKIFEDEDDEQMKERGFEGGRGVFYIQEYLEIVKKLAPKLYNKVISKYNKNQILKAINNLDINNNFCEYCGGDIDLDEEDNYYGYFVTGSQSPNSLGRGVSRFNEIAEETQWIYYGYCCAYCEEDYLQVMGTNELDWLVGEEATYYMIPEEDVEKSDEWQESFEAKQERKPRKLCVKCLKQRLTPHATNKGITVCATCQRRLGMKSKKAESFDAQDEPRKKCINCNKQKLTPSATSKGYTICGTCTRRYNLGGRKYAEESGEDEYKFVGRIPKSMGIGEKTEILRNNLEYVFLKANRPLYPREVVELYNGERGSGKQSKFKKGGLSTGKISRLIKSEPQKYYVSRSGLIHHVGESSMKDYIRNLPAKYYAEETNRMLISHEDILKYLQNSPEYIRKYTAPWKYTSYGMAEEFGVAPSSMRNVLRKMELKGLLKTISKSVEDSPVPTNRKIKIYYLADKRLMN